MTVSRVLQPTTFCCARSQAGNTVHLRHNGAAQQLALTDADLAELGHHFAPPRDRKRLAVR